MDERETRQLFLMQFVPLLLQRADDGSAIPYLVVFPDSDSEEQRAEAIGFVAMTRLMPMTEVASGEGSPWRVWVRHETASWWGGFGFDGWALGDGLPMTGPWAQALLVQQFAAVVFMPGLRPGDDNSKLLQTLKTGQGAFWASALIEDAPDLAEVSPRRAGPA